MYVLHRGQHLRPAGTLARVQDDGVEDDGEQEHRVGDGERNGESRLSRVRPQEMDRLNHHDAQQRGKGRATAAGQAEATGQLDPESGGLGTDESA